MITYGEHMVFFLAIIGVLVVVTLGAVIHVYTINENEDDSEDD